MTQETLEKIKGYFDRGVYKLSQIRSMLNAGKITQEEYDYIVGA